MTTYLKVLFFILIFTAFIPIAAHGGEHDAIYMKDSSIVRGYIIMDVPNDYVKILTIADTTTEISYDLIDHIKKEDDSRLGISKYGRSYRWIQDGIFARTGFIFLDRGNPVLVIGFDISRRIIKNASIGIGAVFDNYPFEDAFRFYGEFRMTPIKYDIAPIFIANFGYATCFDGLDSRFRNGGVSYAVGFGLQIWQLDHICLHMDVLHKTQYFEKDIQLIDKYSEYVNGSHLNTWQIMVGLSI